MTDLSGWNGRDVVDPSGDKIGPIEDIYLDEQTTSPSGWPCGRGSSAGASGSCPSPRPRATGDAVAVPYTKHQDKDAPNAEPDGLLSEQEEARLYEYYGLPYSDARSDTGLPEGGSSYETTATQSTERHHSKRRRHDPLRGGAAGGEPPA